MSELEKLVSGIIILLTAYVTFILGRNRSLENKVGALEEEKKEEVKSEELKSLSDDALLSRFKRALKSRTKNSK